MFNPRKQVGVLLKRYQTFRINTDLASAPDLNSRIYTVDYELSELRTPQIGDIYIIYDPTKKSREFTHFFLFFSVKCFYSNF